MKKKMPFTFKKRFLNLVIPATVILATAVLPGCAINPATGKIDTVTMTNAREISLGKELYEEMIKGLPIYTDEALNTYVDEVGQRIAAAGDRTNIEYHFTVVDSPDINAFALPGGYIFINRGLITYLQNEAQLAAVLGHEVAHVTARHTVRQQSARAGRNVGAVFAAILTGSSTVASAAAQWSDAAIAGYGREMELEADGFGAEYIRNAGYSGEAMIDVIGILKDHERFTKQQAKDQKRSFVAYHGVFATHPRNDKRLREAVESADGQNNRGKLFEERFQEKTEGLVWGENFDRPATKTADKKQPKENRYTHNRLGFTLLFPDEWTVSNKNKAIVGEPTDQSASLNLTVARVDPKGNFEDILRDKFNVNLLKQSEPLNQFGLRGHTGIKSGEGNDERIAILVHGNRGYILQGKVEQADESINYDQLFMRSIRSFQPARTQAPQTAKKRSSKVIKYVTANQNTTFSRLAHQLKLGQYGEEQLRLINGYYPRGEPLPGERIKIVQ